MLSPPKADTPLFHCAWLWLCSGETIVSFLGLVCLPKLFPAPLHLDSHCPPCPGPIQVLLQDEEKTPLTQVHMKFLHFQAPRGQLPCPPSAPRTSSRKTGYRQVGLGSKTSRMPRRQRSCYHAEYSCIVCLIDHNNQPESCQPKDWGFGTETKYRG